MGLISFFINPNDKLLSELPSDGAGFEPVFADADAVYENEYSIDLTNLAPLIAAPFEPHNVHPVRDFLGTKIDSAFVGSCTNGRMSDIQSVHEIISNGGVKDGIMLRIVPSTRNIQKAVLSAGYAMDFIDAGCVFSHAACAGCASGQIGMTGDGEVQISTGNRNFKGKQGNGKTFLASPIVAAYAAQHGEIWLPK
jgi:homoaconitase/3-isopropylmalate dehydratase large subunit